VGENVTPELRPNQLLAIQALTATGRISEAAAAAGVARKTVYAWLREPAFKSQLDEAARAALGELARTLALGSQDAAGVLRSIMSNTKQPGHVRVRAALGWITAMSSLYQIFEFEARLAALEDRLNEQT
jgi:hypothetical protein